MRKGEPKMVKRPLSAQACLSATITYNYVYISHSADVKSVFVLYNQSKVDLSLAGRDSVAGHHYCDMAINLSFLLYGSDEKAPCIRKKYDAF